MKSFGVKERAQRRQTTSYFFCLQLKLLRRRIDSLSAVARARPPAVMRYTFIVIAAFRTIDRSFGTQYANNGRRKRTTRRRVSGIWRALQRYRRRRLNIPPTDRKERKRGPVRSYFRSATPSIGKADEGKKVRTDGGVAAFACHVP